MKNIYQLCQQKVVIAAEIGINHNGDIGLAEEMIAAAAECGADAVKFQGFHTHLMYSTLTPGFKHTGADIFALMKSLELKDEWWPRLRTLAKEKNLYFSASVFDPASLQALARTGVDFVKIASAEINNIEFMIQQKTLGNVFVVSTGMALLEEIALAVRRLKEEGVNDIILLECTSSYPAPPESIHLLNIDFLRETFRLPSGFSDHTSGSHHAVAAAARGARFIEKHFTLDKNMPGPDQKISSDPAEMKQLVQTVREVELALKGNSKLSYSPHEQNSRDIGRKSLIAIQEIPAGAAVTPENTIIKRPAKGVPPNEAPFLYGRTAKKTIAAEQWITWDMVQ